MDFQTIILWHVIRLSYFISLLDTGIFSPGGGFDKVCINTKAAEDIEFITRAAEVFGDQCSSAVLGLTAAHSPIVDALTSLCPYLYVSAALIDT